MTPIFTPTRNTGTRTAGTRTAGTRWQRPRLALWARLWARVCLRWRRWRDTRITRRALSALDDRMLKDIGVARWEIESRFHRPAGRPVGWWQS